ncbi:DUF859 family phage minor structural protein [Anaerotignum sp.]
MATSGTIQADIRTGYRIQIAWTVDSQSVANNTSTVTAKVQLVSTGSSYTINSSVSKSGSLTINGTKYTFSFTAALSGSQTKTVFTKTVTVAHSADGTKTCSFSATCGINVTLSGTYYGNVTASGSGTFNTIARASTISSVTSSVSVTGSNAVTVNITRAASSFTHTVVFSFGSYSNTQTGVGTSASYTIPQTWLNAMPNGTSGTAKVTVTTYSGSTKIGSAVSKNFTLTVPSTVVPTISAVTLSEAVSGIAAQFGGYVQNKSKIAVKITASGSLSSTIKAYKTTIQGANFTAASFTSGFLTKSGTSNVTVTVTDSRGRTASTTKSITVIAYSAPTITSFQGFRCLANGTENYEGTYLNVTPNFSISPVGDKNTKSYSVEYKLKSATSWTTLTSGAVYALNKAIISTSGFMSVDNSYDIRLSVTDFFTTVRSTIEIPTAFTLLDFNASGKGIAFGKVSEMNEGIEFALPTVFSHAETPSSVKYLNTGQDLNDILEPGFYAIPSTSVGGTLLNKPWTASATGSLMVLAEGNAGQRTQIAHKGTKGDGCIYERAYYSSSWGEWQIVHNGGGKVLWSGGLAMQDGQAITLAEPVSAQAAGIVLVFSRYSANTVQNYHYNHFFVHKAFVAAHPGVGSQFMLTTDGTFGVVASKYIYINDTAISGNANNVATGTGTSGITYNNAGFVLRYVIGV